MKNLFIIFSILLSISCNAQSPIIDITKSELGQPNGYYSKDINNLLNPFQGTYVYTNGATSFKIVLIKKVQQYNGRYYEDLIVGEYQYIDNGVEKINTLNQINTIYNDQRSHNIDGNWIVNNDFRYWKCSTCLTNEKRICCSIKDISTNRYAKITMRRTVIGGQDVMQIKISHVTGESYVVGQPMPLNFSLPLGEFTLIKQ